MKINTKEIKEISNIILSFLVNKVEKIDIENDYYSLISSDEWYNFESNDKQPIVGSLEEDLTLLKQIIEQKREVSFSDLDRLSSIFRAVSQEVNPI